MALMFVGYLILGLVCAFVLTELVQAASTKTEPNEEETAGVFLFMFAASILAFIAVNQVADDFYLSRNVEVAAKSVATKTEPESLLSMYGWWVFGVFVFLILVLVFLIKVNVAFEKREKALDEINRQREQMRRERREAAQATHYRDMTVDVEQLPVSTKAAAVIRYHQTQRENSGVNSPGSVVTEESAGKLGGRKVILD